MLQLKEVYSSKPNSLKELIARITDMIKVKAETKLQNIIRKLENGSIFYEQLSW